MSVLTVVKNRLVRLKAFQAKEWPDRPDADDGHVSDHLYNLRVKGQDQDQIYVKTVVYMAHNVNKSYFYRVCLYLHS